jgi:hypothetical protein
MKATRFGLVVRDLSSMHEVLGSILIVNKKKKESKMSFFFSILIN